MMMPGRKYSAVSGYRYGFNGKENDNEVKGEGNEQDYGMRIYDTRVGRFLSVDPITKKYPDLTPYQFASNSPISGIDLDGLEYFYAADGSFIAKSRDNNTQVRVIQANDVATAWQLLRRKEGATVADLNNISTDVGMTNAELNLRASLSTLKQAEAGTANPPLDYNSWYGTGETFTDKTYEQDPSAYAKHPGDDKTKEGTNTAAGAYQFLEGSYYGENSLTESFSPQAQDQAAVNLMTPGGYEAATTGDMEKFKTTLSKRWTSLKYWKVDELQSEFQKNVSAELNSKSKIGAPKGKLLTRQTDIPATVKKQKQATTTTKKASSVKAKKSNTNTKKNK